ncbi:S53 family peptidase [Actinoplanes sp. NPDC051411]|uniref:S53 family peptidase n=1 Tax=Actinoplanes sp. NPDC051411 TaxID=3155522 RepID=UPI0034227703
MRLRNRIPCLLAAGPLVAAIAAPVMASEPRPDFGRTVPGSTPVAITITLRSPAESQLRSYATAVSDPGTTDYRKFLTDAQLRQRFGASRATVAQVAEWARAEGFRVGPLDATGSRLPLTASAATVQRAFGVTIYDSAEEGVRAHTSTAVRLPPRIAADVTAISGLNQQAALAMHVRPTTAATNQGGSCLLSPAQVGVAAVQSGLGARVSMPSCGYTGPQLRAMYGLSPADDGAGQTIVIVGAFNQTSTFSDANAAFARTKVPPLAPGQYQVKTYPAQGAPAAGCDTASWGLEQALDVQTVHTLAPAARIVYAAAPDCTQLTDVLAHVISDPVLRGGVVSNSWGYPAEALSNDEVTATDAILARAAVLGTGTYTASGLYGSAVATGMLLPDRSYPASSPWTTAVGGTTAAISANQTLLWQTGWASTATTLSGKPVIDVTGTPVIAAAGGGASIREPRPVWQPAGRGGYRQVPDLAALADPETGLLVGTTSAGQYSIGGVGGTSLATPIVASLAALAQARAGHPAGLLGPRLWHTDDAGGVTLTDIRHVDAAFWTPRLPGAPTDPDGYLVRADSAASASRPGWDPVTGLGAPGRTFLADVG